MGEDLGKRREPLSEGFPSLSKPLSSFLNFPEPGLIQSAWQFGYCVALQSASGYGIKPGSGKFGEVGEVVICFVDRLSHLFGWFLLFGYRTRLVVFLLIGYRTRLARETERHMGRSLLLNPFGWVFVDRRSHTFGWFFVDRLSNPFGL